MQDVLKTWRQLHKRLSGTLDQKSISQPGKSPKAQGKRQQHGLNWMLSFCHQISSAVNTSGVLLLLPPNQGLLLGNGKQHETKREVVVHVPESILDKVLTNGVTSNASEINLLCTTLESSTTRETTSRIKFFYVQCFKSFVHSNLKLSAPEAATCSLLPLYLPIQTWKKKKNRNPSWPLSETCLLEILL